MMAKLSFGGVLTCLSLFSIAGCNSATKTGSSENSSVSEPQGGLETVAILGTNDIHGALAPQSLNTRETPGTPSVQYEAGGASVLASYIKILQNEFGDHFIWLDAGDEFQGSIESNLEQGAPMVQFFNSAGLNAAAIGNHEFDFGLIPLKTRMQEAHYPYLAANISNKATHESANFPNTYPHWMITAGKLKIGIIGLSTLETPVKTRAENVKTLQFDDLKEATLREAQTLRQLGARVILVTAHVGLFCSPGKTSPARMIRKPSDPQGDCGSHDEMVQLLQALPVGTVDGVISGHTHSVVHHWVAGVPVIQGGAFGRYFNVIYLTYDWAQKRLLMEQTRIEGPVPVCSRIFANQNDCNGDRPAPKMGRGPLIPAKFHGKTVTADSHTQKLLGPILKKSEVEKNRVLGHAIRPIEHNRLGRESALGNLVADAIRKSARTDFALVNPGGIRASLEQGPITYGAVFRTMPFDNMISVLKVTAQELKNILRVAESGSRGFPAVSGINLRLIDPFYEAPSDDLDGSGKDEIWKINRLIDMHLPNNQPLQSKKIYTLATLDFLVTGGDDLGWPMSQIPADRIQMNTGILVRDALIQYIEEKQGLNSGETPLVDKQRPRLKFEKPPVQKIKIAQRKKRGRRRKS